MTLIYAGPSRPIQSRPVHESRSGQVGGVGGARSRRPGPSRPGGAPLRYRGTGIAVSRAPHRKPAVTPLTTVGLALLAGLITLWLGAVANFGSMINGDSSDATGRVPDSLAVVRVEPGESLQDVAARVAPEAPARQVVERIRELNALNSSALSAGQTLIAPVG